MFNMLEKIILILGAVLLGTRLLPICNASGYNHDKEGAQTFTLDASEQIFDFYDNLRDEMFDEDVVQHNPNVFFNSFDRSQSIVNESMLLIEIVKQAKEFSNISEFGDKSLEHAFEALKRIADEKIIGGERYLEIVNSLDNLRERYLRESYFYEDTESDLDANYGIPRYAVPLVIETSNNSKEIEFYWKEVRKTSGEWAKDNLNLTLEGLRDAANLSDLSPLNFWMRRYNLSEMENLMNQLQPLYSQLHAFIRTGLLKKYGDSIMKADGLIPHHLFEQVMAQSWTNGSIIDDIFPFENLPFVHFDSLNKKFLTKRFEYAERFFQTLGFSDLGPNIWKDDIRKKKEEHYSKAYRCYSDIYYSSPKIYLGYCEENDFMQFLEAYDDMTKLYYANSMTFLPAYFFSAHDLEYAVGKAIMLSASTLNNLKAIGMILESSITQQVEMNRLVRKSIKSLLSIATDFVHTKLMADLLSENIDLSELNARYWQLMDKYVGVEPPMSHKVDPDSLNMPVDFYYDMNDNKFSRNFNSEILSYQIYKRLCKLSEKYPKDALHLCDFSGSTEAGKSLKNMMNLGSQKMFNETLATLIPKKPFISIEAILEYYNPVKEFLKKKNSETNAKPGWKHDDTKSYGTKSLESTSTETICIK